MTLSELYTYARNLTKTTTTQYSNADLLVWAKVWIKDIQREVVSVRQDYFGDIVDNTGVLDQEDYPLPDDCLDFRKLEVCYNSDAEVASQNIGFG